VTDYFTFARENARREFPLKKSAINRQAIPDLSAMLEQQPPLTHREELELLYGKEYAEYLTSELDPRD
jgi:hypothetical protein